MGAERVLSEEEEGASRGIMVLLAPQTHLQKEVGFAGGFVLVMEGRGGFGEEGGLQAEETRVVRFKMRRERMAWRG